MRVLVMEASSTSSKAMIYDTNNGIIDLKTKAYPKDISFNGLHDVDGIYNELISRAKELDTNYDIDAITLVGTWHNFFFCDDKKSPLSKAYTWESTFGSEYISKLREDIDYVKFQHSITGCMVNAIYPVNKLQAMKNSGDDFTTKNIMNEISYVFYKLTGDVSCSESCASGFGLLNLDKLKWDKDILNTVGLDITNLPKIVRYDYTYPIKKEVADILKVAAETPVFIGEPDGAMNQLGAGALLNNTMTISVGTSAAARMVIKDEQHDPILNTWCYYAANMKLAGVAVSGATNCLDWFLDMFGGEYKTMEENISIDENSPFFLPFLFGERCPHWDDSRKGGFHNITGVHTKKDCYVAILEGILYCLYDSYLILTESLGHPDKILLSGGILKSESWLQMMADIWGRELCLQKTDQASMMGSVVIACEKFGIIDKLQDFSSSVEIINVCKPNQKNRELYLKRFEKYKAIYNSQNKL